MIESPKAMSAGIVTFGGSFNALVLYDKTNKKMKHNIKLVVELVLANFIILCYLLLFKKVEHARDSFFIYLACILRKFIHPQNYTRPYKSFIARE
jgi:hypothetical protein